MLYNETRVIQRTLWAFDNKVRSIIHQGGTSSGKTYGGLYALLTYVLHDRRGGEADGEKLTVSIVSENLPHLRRGALRDFKNIIGKLNLSKVMKFNKTNSVFTLPSGTEIEFFAVDNEAKARSGKRDILFVNECNSVDWMIFWQLSVRTTETVMIDYNPSSEFWLHTDYLPTLEKGDYLFTRTTYKDNPALSSEMLRVIENITDEYLSKVYKEGKTGAQKGLILKNIRLVDEMPKDGRKRGLGLDFGYSISETSCVDACWYDGEIWVEELFYETELLNSHIVAKLNDNEVSKKKSISADSAEPKSIAEIKAAGFNIKGVSKGADSIEYGLGLLNQVRINIVKTSINLISETKKYKRNSKGKVIPKFDHAIDALRYWAMENLAPAKKKAKVTGRGSRKRNYH